MAHAAVVSIGGKVKTGDSVILDAASLPAKSRTMKITLGGVNYVVSFETIKCKMKALGEKFEKATVEDQLKTISGTIADQIAEVSEEAKRAEVYESVVDTVFGFLLGYFVKFMEGVIHRIYVVGEAILGIIYRFLRWLGSFFD